MLNRHYGSGLLVLLTMAMFPCTTLAQSTFDVNGNKYRIDRFPDVVGASKRPTVVIIHGIDGIDGPSGKQIAGFATQLDQAGFLVFVPHYFDNRDGSSSISLTDLVRLRLGKSKEYQARVAAAIDYAVQQSDADPARLGLVGLSLGAGPALRYAETQPVAKVKAVVDFFGYLPDQQLYTDADKLPPTLVLHNKDDKFVPVEMSEKLVKSLDAAGIEHDSKIYDNGDLRGATTLLRLEGRPT